MTCEICGSIRGPDRHHIILKGMGGSRGPAVHDQSNLLTLCRSCHERVHQGVWELHRSEIGIQVVDQQGQQVMRRRYNAELDVSSLFQLLNEVEDSLARLGKAVPYLADDQLVEAFSYASSFSKRSWLVQAAILYEAQQRSIYGDRSLEAISRRFEISQRQAQKYALVWKVFFAGEEGQENVNVDAILLDQPSWYVVAASETKDPEQWLGYAQDRKVEDPKYSVSAFRSDIQRARGTGLDSESGDFAEARPVELPELETRSCPWIQKFCLYPGKPVPVSQCQACQFENNKKCQTKPNSWEA